MRPRATAIDTDRHRNEATAEPHYRDEGFQAHLHPLVPVSVPAPAPDFLPVPIAVAVAITEQSQPVVAPNAVPIAEPDALMTNLSPTDDYESDDDDDDVAEDEDDGPATATTTIPIAVAATPTAPFVAAAAAVTLHEDIHGVEIHNHNDIDHYNSAIDLGFDSNLDLDLPFYASPWPQYLIEPDYITSNPGDYDLDMSDSDGGAPLDGIIATANSDFFTPQLPLQDHLSAAPDEDDHVQVPNTSPFDYSHPFLSNPPVVEGPVLIMDDLLPPGWGTPPDQQQVPQPEPPEYDPSDDDILLSNPNPTMFGGDNVSLMEFLRRWANDSHASPTSPAQRVFAPSLHGIREQASRHIEEVRYSDLRGDYCDMQGLDWVAMETTQERARERRFLTYKNYVNIPGTDKWTPHLPDVMIPSTDSFFRFRNMLFRRDVYLAHFQLRSILACPSRTQVFYPVTRGINRLNPISKKTELAINMRGMSSLSNLSGVISTLDANHGVLMAGTFKGEYYLKNINSENAKHFADGQITSHPGGITNHLQIHLPRRSSGPVAALSSNDKAFRVMDLTTEKLLFEKVYDFSLNCTSISPDGRLRAMVGDHFDVIIADAETGQFQRELSGHRDFGFSCDWSDDGWAVATGFQDRGVKIWDARRWCDSNGISTPLCTIRSRMANVRNLRFSPMGSGQRVLVAAEEADCVNIIDAQTFDTKQVVEIFGEIGGVAFTNDGQDLSVLCCDYHRGGLLQLERCGRGPEPFFNQPRRRESEPSSRLDGSEELLYADKPYHRRPGMRDAVAIF
ncbi:hypothetical protein AK830_g6598 [Neonectria ditissima]|uniref:Uncharacterized protein n=1 Tax=Neonectria ditissima TaxID=78410 RepID=A0A0P7BBX9_9HYPO|nr:hypothetical protein AK830_g6598 [Neonectria ditissima]